MTDIQALDSPYCPRCGDPVEAAQKVVVTNDGVIDELFIGEFRDEDRDIHIDVNQGEVCFYRHEVTP